MRLSYGRVRPGLLTLIGVISLLWSSWSLLRLAIMTVFALGLGVASWVGGPYTGAIGSLMALVAMIWLVVSSLLSILLFQAGLKTLQNDPAGVRLHRLWAWISLGFAVFGVLISRRGASHSWVELFYAVGVLYVTGLPEVRAYFGHVSFPTEGKPETWDDEFDGPRPFVKKR